MNRDTQFHVVSLKHDNLLMIWKPSTSTDLTYAVCDITYASSTFWKCKATILKMNEEGRLLPKLFGKINGNSEWIFKANLH